MLETPPDRTVTAPGAEHPACESFDDCGVDERLLRGIYAYGFERPTLIQQRAIQPVLDGLDTICHARPGTGRTAAFTIGCLHRVDQSRRACQALILTPARELSLQVQRLALAMGEYLGVSCHACIGGIRVRDDIEKLNAGPHLVAGTPGRVLDMIRRGALRVDDVATVVLEEADEMLARGFHEQVRGILDALPPGVQACLFSATMPQELLELAGGLMRDAVQVTEGRGLPLDARSVRHFYVAVEEAQKPAALCDLCGALPTARAVVHCGARCEAEALASALNRACRAVFCLHAGMDQQERDIVVQEFRSGPSGVLLCAGVDPRGADLTQQERLVINYDLPASAEGYLQRLCREGLAISFAASRDAPSLREVERLCHAQIEELPAEVADLL